MVLEIPLGENPYPAVACFVCHDGGCHYEFQVRTPDGIYRWVGLHRACVQHGWRLWDRPVKPRDVQAH